MTVSNTKQVQNRLMPMITPSHFTIPRTLDTLSIVNGA
jgi:hypothetical protein